VRVWPLLFAMACQQPTGKGPKEPHVNDSSTTDDSDDDYTDLGLDHEGDFTYLHLAPNDDRDLEHRLLGFFAQSLQGMPFAATCVISGELCVDQVPADDDTWLAPTVAVFNPALDPIVWLGDRIYIDGLPLDFVADAEADLGWYDRRIEDFPDDALLDISVSGEWETSTLDAFVPVAEPMEILTPDVHEFLGLATTQFVEITWTPGDGQVYLEVSGPNSLHKFYKLADDGAYELDVTEDLGAIVLGDLFTFDLIRVVEATTDLRGNTLFGRGISTQRFQGGFARPASCQDHLDNDPGAASGIYEIQPNIALPTVDVFCEMEVDGGGWTLVAASANEPLDDAAGPWHPDLISLTPASANQHVWEGMRDVIDTTSDIRFACKVDPLQLNMDVDLSFYDAKWYREFTTGSDADSCFSEFNGAGYDTPAVERKNNLNGDTRPLGVNWDTEGYLEGEDTCEDLDDFSIDFTDRGMDGNQSDGTDWGEDDGSWKCGTEGLATGAWFVFVRE